MASSRKQDDARALLRIYVNDHRGGSAGGVALARRAAHNNLGTDLGQVLRVIVAEIEEDAEALAAVAHRASISDDPVKRVVARVGELVRRLKTNGRLHQYSPLSRLMELELLLSAIDTKRSLWRSLGAARIPELAAFDFELLQQRSTDQRALLLPYHAEAASDAFHTPVGSAPHLEVTSV